MRIPNRVVKVLRETINKHNKHKRADKMPLSWVAAQLAKHHGAIPELVKALNGRYIGFYKDPEGEECVCCGGHRKDLAVYHCVRRQGIRNAELCASIPNVGVYKVKGLSWELDLNALTYFSTTEQMKTIDDLRGPRGAQSMRRAA